VILSLPLQAATVSIANADFSGAASHNFSSWECPVDTSNCSSSNDSTSLNKDPYWMRVNNNYHPDGINYSAHFGAAFPDTDWMYQTITGLTAGSVYTIGFTYGEVNAYNSYAPALQAGEFDMYWTTTSNAWTEASGPPTPVLSEPISEWATTATTANSGTFVTGSEHVTATNSSMILGFGGYDYLQDLAVTNLTISLCTGSCNAGSLLLTSQNFVENEWVGNSTILEETGDFATPEPRTLGLMAVSLAILLAAAKRMRSARV
jgi:hypothetical protein